MKMLFSNFIANSLIISLQAIILSLAFFLLLLLSLDPFSQLYRWNIQKLYFTGIVKDKSRFLRLRF